MPSVVPNLTGTPGRIRHAGQPLGHETEAVLGELLGLDDDELGRLRDGGII